MRHGATRVPGVRMLLLGLFAAWCCFPAADGRAELIDRVVASVNNDVITLSDLRQAVAFNRAVSGKEAGKQGERETLEGLVNRRLLLQEAGRIRAVEVSEADVAAERERFRVRLGSEDALRAFLSGSGLTVARLNGMLAERLLVERFVQKKIGLFARVGHEEAEAYYAEHAASFKGRRFSEVQARITALLSEQKAGQQLDQYLADLRNRAEVRINPLDDH